MYSKFPILLVLNYYELVGLMLNTNSKLVLVTHVTWLCCKAKLFAVVKHDSHDVKQVSKTWEFPFVTRKWFDREDVLMNDAMCLVGLTFWLAHWSTDAWKLPLHSVETDKLSNFIYNCMTVVFKLLLAVHIGKSPSHSPCVLHFLKVITSCWTRHRQVITSWPPKKETLPLSVQT